MLTFLQPMPPPVNRTDLNFHQLVNSTCQALDQFERNESSQYQDFSDNYEYTEQTWIWEVFGREGVSPEEGGLRSDLNMKHYLPQLEHENQAQILATSTTLEPLIEPILNLIQTQHEQESN